MTHPSNPTATRDRVMLRRYTIQARVPASRWVPGDLVFFTDSVASGREVESVKLGRAGTIEVSWVSGVESFEPDKLASFVLRSR